MLNKIKKGFTIVELVIVIAVIAILAGVLIPTFSSVTKNAKQSAAMQQAKNAMEATLVLTGGSYTDGTDFLVAEGENQKADYWFEYSGNKLNDVTGKAPATAEYEEGKYYAAYFSLKCFDDAKKDANYTQSLGILMDAINASDYSAGELASADGYYTLILTKAQENADPLTKTVRIYYTPDIEPTLVIVLGANK